MADVADLLQRLRVVEEAARGMVHSKRSVQHRLDTLRDALDELDEFESTGSEETS